MKYLRGGKGFTLIELLAVISIIVLVMSMALPNFVTIMKGQKWAAAISNIQRMVWRARALATNIRKDMSVEFDIDPDKGTRMWVESEAQALERIPDLVLVQETIASGEGYKMYPGSAIQGLVNLWRDAGGTCEWKDGYYVNFQINQADTRDYRYGDNSRQTEVVAVGTGLTIDTAPLVSPNFINWDAQASVKWAGDDEHRDIRISPSGSLVQTRDPTLCIVQIRGKERRRVRVIRCTGRLVPAR